MPAEAIVEVSEGAIINLDYLGTNEVKRVTLGALVCSGVITAERYPAYIKGTGALYTSPQGTILLLQ